MYPDLSYIVHALVGIEPDNALSIVKTFGLMLIVAFIASAYVLRLELKRKENEGILTSVKQQVTVGKRATPLEVIGNAVIGFILGFKLIYIIQHFQEFQADTAGVLLSSKGSLLGGIIGAAILGFWKWYDGARNALPKPKTQTVEVWPHQRVGDITIVAAISGIAGAKIAAIFESTENFQAFLADPLRQLLSGSGLAIYGGLILAFVVVYYYVQRRGIPPIQMMDAVAPALIVGYGVGRIGCHLSGDGDWGIENTSAAPSWWFLPDSWWANSYSHNVLNEGMPIEGCTWEYCSALSPPVYPTPIYEVFMSLAIFLILWSLRKRIKIPGMLFFLYLVLVSIERFFIEKIRVNPDIEFLGIKASQAEYVSVLLFIVGIIGLGILYFRNHSKG